MKYVDTIGQILVDFVSRSDVPRREPSGGGVKLAAIIYYDKYLDGEEVVVLPTVADDAREIQELLEEKFKYQLLSEDPNPNVLQSCQEKQLQNERNLVKTFELRLKKWKNGVDIGTIVDTFLIYFHGHGTEVLKNPCLLTRKWTAIPVDELVNLVTEVINPIHYCLVLDCCSNYKADTKAIKRLEEAIKTRAKDFGDRLITVSAAPSGHTAMALKGKTLTAALVVVLKESLDQGIRGIPLQELEWRLRQEQEKAGSSNLPTVLLPSKLSGKVFPL